MVMVGYAWWLPRVCFVVRFPLGPCLISIHACIRTCTSFFFHLFLCVFPAKKNMFTHVFRPVLCGIQPSFHTYFCMYICKYVLLWFFDGAHHKDIPIIAEWSSSSSLFLPIFHSFLHGLSAIWALSISISEASRLHNAFWYIFPFYSFFSIYF